MASIYDTFMNEIIMLSPYNDSQNVIEKPLNTLFMTYATLAETAYAIDAYYDKHSSNHFYGIMIEGLKNISTRENSENDVSIIDMVKVIRWYSSEFHNNDLVMDILYNNHCSTNGEFKDYPNSGYVSFGQLHDKHHLSYLVRGFRFYLIETIRSVFHPDLDESEWNISNISYGKDNTIFLEVVESLLEMNTQIKHLSEDCYEFKKLENILFQTNKRRGFPLRRKIHT